MSGERMPFPTNADVIRSLIEQHAEGVYTAFPARLQGWSSETQTADCVPLIQHAYDDPEGSGRRLFEDLPVIPSVAVIQMRSRGAFLSLPIADGDTVLCLVATQDIGTWRRSTDANVVTPRDTRRNHIGSAVALAGFYRHGEHLREASVRAADVDDDSGIVLGYDAADGTRLLMKPDGVLDVVHGTAAVLRVEAGAPAGPPQAVALAAATDAIVSSLKSLIAGWTPTGTGDGAALKALIATWSPGTTAAAKVKAT